MALKWCKSITAHYAFDCKEINEMEQQKLKTAPELAAELGMKVNAVYRYTREGEFDEFLVKVGDKPQYRYRPDGLAEYIRRGGSKSATEK
jgi:hypothetical protein